MTIDKSPWYIYGQILCEWFERVWQAYQNILSNIDTCMEECNYEAHVNDHTIREALNNTRKLSYFLVLVFVIPDVQYEGHLEKG